MACFQADPGLGTESLLLCSASAQRRLEDSFDNVNWKLEGRLGELDIVYAGAYTKRGNRSGEWITPITYLSASIFLITSVTLQ